MSVADADIAFATDLFAPLGNITSRKMFGGMCFYQQGVVFALLSSEGRIYLKLRGTLAQDLSEKGSTQFHNMPYWSIPDDLLEDQEAALALTRRAIDLL